MSKRGVNRCRASWGLRRTGLLVLFLVISLALIGPVSVQAAPSDYARLVNPFIGTAGPGHTLPGAVLPWGMVYISPDTSPDTPVSYAGGYQSGDPYILGFSQVHASGFGCADLGNILITPTVGQIATSESGYRSAYDAEQAVPGYYRVHLRTPNVIAEMTATTRATFSRYAFPARSGDANILVDVTHTLSPYVDGASVSVVSKTEIDGWARTGRRCGAKNLQTVYFVARFSKPAVSSGTWNGSTGSTAGSTPSQQGTRIGAYVRYTTAPNDVIDVRIGISFVSIANARLNLDTELPADKTFAQVKANAYAAWNAQLARIGVIGGTSDQRTVFYTALYHALLHPSTFGDVNGQYQGSGTAGVMTANGYTRYHLFSTWDTYKGLHSLLVLVYPEHEQDMMRSLVEMSKETGWLPRWEIGGNDTYGMVGDNAAVLIANAYLKGIKNIDINAAYAAMKKNATDTDGNPIRSGLQPYLKYGYIPKDDTGGDFVWGTVSTSLEYYYDDWSIAQVAHALGGPAMDADETLFLSRSLNYKNLYDSSTGFLRPRNANGSWMTPFDPRSQCCDQAWPDSGGPGFVEGSAWQYTFNVPYDIAGLKQMIGGDATFTSKLQQAFDGGQYGLWNEPDFTYAYLFTFVSGQTWRTQRQVRLDMANLFHSARDGLPGNDDGGATSTMYVFDAIGFYPVSPASTRYQVGSPIFDTITIQLDPAYYPGGQFVIQTKGNSSGSPYIQRAALNGSAYYAAYLDHGQMTRGGTFTLAMGKQQTGWGSDGMSAPLAPEN